MFSFFFFFHFFLFLVIVHYRGWKNQNKWTTQCSKNKRVLKVWWIYPCTKKSIRSNKKPEQTKITLILLFLNSSCQIMGNWPGKKNIEHKIFKTFWENSSFSLLLKSDRKKQFFTLFTSYFICYGVHDGGRKNLSQNSD